MAKKNRNSKKKNKKKTSTRKKKATGTKLRSRRSKAVRGTVARASARKKVKRPSKRSRPETMVRATREARVVGSLDAATIVRRGLGSGSAGQSGDTQGLSSGEWADSESVEELVEEGQDFEAGVVAGVEDALDADQGEVRTKEVLEDDVPLEYLDKD